MASKKTVTQDNDMTMKIVVIVALIISFVGGYFVARAKYKPQLMELTKMVMNKDEAMQKMKADANKVLMKDGKMWVVESGMVKEMDADIVMSNGDKVMSDGKVVKADGTEAKMENGDAMDMSGKMLPGEGSKTDTTKAVSY